MTRHTCGGIHMGVRTSRLVLLVTSGVLAVGLLAAVLIARVRTDQPPAGPLIWSDEFDGPAGSAPDPTKWKNDVGGHGWGNQELQYYTDGSANTFLDGRGHLVIEARQESPAGLRCGTASCAYTSGRLISAGRFSHAYGRYEARIKVPAGRGTWPAFWMLGDDIAAHPWPASGEIDVMEHVGQEPGTLHGSAHGPEYSGTGSITRGYTLPGDGSLSDDFHTYAVDWSPDGLAWSIDGKVYGRMDRSDVGDRAWVLDKPYFLLLNLAIGGVWPGPPDASTSFPLRMVVDYVRVYDRPGASASATTASAAVPTGTPVALRGYGDNCLDVKDGAETPGTAVHMWQCLPVDSQRWTLGADGTLRTLGACLTPAGGHTEDGTPLQLATCSGAAEQRFRYDATSRALIADSSGKCLDVSDFSTQNGALLQLWSCAGSANQRWTSLP